MNNNTTTKTAEQVKGHEQVRAIRQWRVGTISMGLTLIVLGITLFLGKLNDSFTIQSVLKLWPFILIILGIEMVVLNFLTSKRGGQFRFAYDILSIFLVLALVFVSIGFVSLESTGVLAMLGRSVAASERFVESEQVLYTADDDLQTLTLTVEGHKTIVHTYDGNDIRAKFVYRGNFLSLAEGQQYAEEQLVQVERLDDNLLINVYPPSRGYKPNDFVEQEVTLFIPRHLDVEHNQLRGDHQLHLHKLESNWQINHQADHAYTEIKLSGIADARLELAGTGELSGNIHWDREDVDEELGTVEAEKTWGSGDYTLALRHESGTIKVNEK